MEREDAGARAGKQAQQAEGPGSGVGSAKASQIDAGDEMGRAQVERTHPTCTTQRIEVGACATVVTELRADAPQWKSWLPAVLLLQRWWRKWRGKVGGPAAGATLGQPLVAAQRSFGRADVRKWERKAANKNLRKRRRNKAKQFSELARRRLRSVAFRRALYCKEQVRIRQLWLQWQAEIKSGVMHGGARGRPPGKKLSGFEL